MTFSERLNFERLTHKISRALAPFSVLNNESWLNKSPCSINGEPMVICSHSCFPVNEKSDSISNQDWTTKSRCMCWRFNANIQQSLLLMFVLFWTINERNEILALVETFSEELSFSHRFVCTYLIISPLASTSWLIFKTILNFFWQRLEMKN